LRRFVVVDAAFFSYGRRTKVRQKYSEAVVADIRVAVLFGLSIWFFLLVVSSFFLFPVSSGCFFLFSVVFGNLVLWGVLFDWEALGIQILDSEVRNVWVCVVWLRRRSDVESS
jgi:hypothetical protein